MQAYIRAYIRTNSKADIQTNVTSNFIAYIYISTNNNIETNIKT